MAASPQRPSWLCRDDVERERVVDMERRLRPVRVIAFAILAGALVVTGQWVGWWTLLPLAFAIAGFGVADRALMRSDLEHRSESVLDGLTGMLNRRSLTARVVELEQQALLTRRPIGLVLGDVDHFKAVNDEHGHGVGDAVLVDVAYTLRKELRAFDLAYRLGGEEFLVLLPGADGEDAAEVAERLRLAIELTPAGGRRVTMSFGVASSGDEPFEYAALVAAANAALYQAKREGRNRVVRAGAGDERATAAVT